MLEKQKLECKKVRGGGNFPPPPFLGETLEGCGTIYCHGHGWFGIAFLLYFYWRFIMYCLMKKIDSMTYQMIYETKDYEFCCKLCAAYKERYSGEREKFCVFENFSK